MGELRREDFDRAERRGWVESSTTPRAVAVRYDRGRDQVVIDLASGATFAFPPRLAQGLADATPAQIGQVEIAGAGFGLHWDELDLDLTVAGLMAGRFGTARYMAERFGAGWNAVAAE